MRARSSSTLVTKRLKARCILVNGRLGFGARVNPTGCSFSGNSFSNRNGCTLAIIVLLEGASFTEHPIIAWITDEFGPDASPPFKLPLQRSAQQLRLHPQLAERGDVLAAVRDPSGAGACGPIGISDCDYPAARRFDEV